MSWLSFIISSSYSNITENTLGLSKEEQKQLGSPKYTPLRVGRILLSTIYNAVQNQVSITVNKLHTYFMNYIDLVDVKVRISIQISQLGKPENESLHRKFITKIRKWKPCVEFSDQFTFTPMDNFNGPYKLKLTLSMMPPHGMISDTGLAALSLYVGDQSKGGSKRIRDYY